MYNFTHLFHFNAHINKGSNCIIWTYIASYYLCLTRFCIKLVGLKNLIIITIYFKFTLLNVLSKLIRSVCHLQDIRCIYKAQSPTPLNF